MTKLIIKENLIQYLQQIQKENGYISNESISKAATKFNINPAEVEGVVSFYTQFKRNKPGKYKIHICDGTACHIKGANLILNWIGELLKISNGETDLDGIFSLETVACLGCCSLAPVISINNKIYGKLDRKKLMTVLKQYQKEALT